MLFEDFERRRCFKVREKGPSLPVHTDVSQASMTAISHSTNHVPMFKVAHAGSWFTSYMEFHNLA